MKKLLVSLMLLCISVFSIANFGCASAVEIIYEPIEWDGEVLVYSVVGVKNAKKEFDIIIPSTYNDKPVQNIKQNAFQNSLLTSIFIPDSVTLIQENSFSGCSSLVNITVDENNPIYKSIDGNLYEKGGNLWLLQYAIGKNDTTFTFPDEDDIIGVVTNGAFKGASNLKSVILSDNVWSIGEYAFAGCDSLETITLGNTNKLGFSIGESAFDDCNNLKDIYFNGTQREWEIIYIGANNECLTNATIHYAE